MKRNQAPLLVYAAMVLTLGMADAASTVRLHVQRGTLGITVPPVTQLLIELPSPDQWPATLLQAVAGAIIEHFFPQESL